MKKKLNVKQFAKLCDVTPRTLKYYEEVGIFKPREVNEKNSYRVYDESQVPEISMIRLLQEHGFSLDEIKEYQTTSDLSKRMEVLNRQKELIERKRQRLQQAEQLVNQASQTLEEACAHMDQPYECKAVLPTMAEVDGDHADAICVDMKKRSFLGYCVNPAEGNEEDVICVYHLSDVHQWEDVAELFQRYVKEHRLILQPVYVKVVLSKDDGSALVSRFMMAKKKKVVVSFGLE